MDIFLTMNSTLECIYSAIGRVNETLPEASQLSSSPETFLFGPKSSLDSLGLVMLISELEEILLKEKGVKVSIADEKAMSQKSSPFLTVSSLASYVETIIDEPTRT